MPIDTSIIEWLQENRPGDLLRILDGDPRYVKNELINAPRNREEANIYKMAHDHVLFLDRFGKAEASNQDGILTSPYPEYFNQWLEVGCPGIDASSIQRYLKLKPIRIVG